MEATLELPQTTQQQQRNISPSLLSNSTALAIFAHSPIDKQLLKALSLSWSPPTQGSINNGKKKMAPRLLTISRSCKSTIMSSQKMALSTSAPFQMAPSFHNSTKEAAF